MLAYTKILILLALLVYEPLSTLGSETQNGKRKTAGQPNVLLLVSEDNGPHFGCYGNKVIKTPVLDKLASVGMMFNNAYTTYSLCSPSRSSLFTGLYPHQNGQVGLATHKYSMYRSFKTLPVYMKEAGYRTAIIGKIHVNPESALPFDHHAIDNSNFARKNLNQYIAQSELFINASTKPFFLMVNLPDAHYPLVKQAGGMPAIPLEAKDVPVTLPFVGVSSDRLRSVTADYYNSLERMDEMWGKIIKKLEESGKAENTIIIYLGDHGAQFSRGKETNYEGGVKIPLIIYAPHLATKGKPNSDLVLITDILPTILEMAGIKPTEHIEGHSLVPLLNNREYSGKRKYLVTTCDGGTSIFFYPTRAIRNHRFKLIQNLQPHKENPKYGLYADHFNEHFTGGTEVQELATAIPSVKQAYALWKNPPEFELYDLKNDPDEFHSLTGNAAYDAVFDELKNALKAWQKSTKDPLSDKKILEAYIAEMEEVKIKYPNHAYQKDPNFKWKFPVLFQQFVSRAD